MDDFFYMLLFAALAIPLTAIAALVVALSQFGAIRRIDARLRALELARAQGSLPRAAGGGPCPRTAGIICAYGYTRAAD